MLPRNQPDGIHIAFDDHRLVNNAGLILPATLALRLGLPQLLGKHLDLGGAPGPAQVQVPVNQLGKAEVQGQGGGKNQPGIVDQAVVVEGKLFRVEGK